MGPKTEGKRTQRPHAIGTYQGRYVVYIRKFVKGIGEGEPGPTPLNTDSQSARDVSYNPEHHDRMKHVQRRHFFIRDMVESFEIEVPYVRTHDNLADFFTKPCKSASWTMLESTTRSMDETSRGQRTKDNDKDERDIEGRVSLAQW